jgi:hypothetical protein
MKIADSTIDFTSSHQKQHDIQEEEHLEQWNKLEDAPERLAKRDRVIQTDSLKSLNLDLSGNELDPKLMKMLRALEALLGRKIIISMPKAHEEQNRELQGWGIDYSYSKTEIKKEVLDFSSKGNIVLEDGKKIDFQMVFSLKSEHRKQESVSFKAGDALVDPLVINFGNTSVGFSEITHTLDLDLNGKGDTFKFVNADSGFLALDKNSDGKINDGSELFGPSSGNGFEDLRAYDKDHNNWIDENDAIFDKLLIWTKDESGKEKFYTLKDKGIGALYLENISTKFDFEDKEENLQGIMQASSLFVKENGKVGSIHEIDVKI